MQELFRHEALPYSGRDRFVAAATSVVRDGLENDQRTLVLAGAAKLDDLRDALGSDADEVTFVPTEDHGRNPSRIATILHNFQAGGDGRHSLGLNEASPSRTAAARLETRFSDAVLNLDALRSWPLSVVCLFDLDGIDDDTRLAIREDHAVVRGDDTTGFSTDAGFSTNADFSPDVALRMRAATFYPPPAAAVRMRVLRPEVGSMRHFVRLHLVGFGISADRIDDLVLAANEIVTNSLRYGGGTADLALWFADGSAICEVSDSGHITDPLAGRFAPPPSASSGRGLWLANQLCDLVQLRSSAAGTVIRMHVDR